MIDMPGSGLGKKPSVLVSNSDSVAGSTSHDAVVEVAVPSDPVFTSAVTDAEAVLAAELPEAFVATVVNVYAVPAVKPLMVQEPEAPVTVHVRPPGDAVTVYDVGASPDVGALTVIVALSSPATTVAVPGIPGLASVALAGVAVFDSAVMGSDFALAVELPAAFVAIAVNVYAVPAVNPSIVQEPDAPSTVQVLPPGDAVTVYDVGALPDVGAVTVMVALSSPATTVATPGTPGAPGITAELFGIVRGPKLRASFPAGSCIALFVLTVLSGVGAE
jgi:hypothetical protein